MIIVRLKGGLGNQIFQYGFGRALSIMKSSQLVFDKTWYFVNALTKSATPRRLVLNKFWIRDCSIRLMPVKYCMMERRNRSGTFFRKSKTTFINEDNLKNIDDIYNIDNAYFDGYWQQYSRLNRIRNLLVEEVVPKASLLSRNCTRLVKESSEPGSVAIHFRRGDYVTDVRTSNYHGLCSTDYYNSSIEYLRRRISIKRLFVFSDDIEWVKDNFMCNLPITYIDDSFNLNDVEAFWVMSKCSHFVIANSSFSWWAAWLSNSTNKIVIAPKKWLACDSNKEDQILPDDWIRI